MTRDEQRPEPPKKNIDDTCDTRVGRDFVMRPEVLARSIHEPGTWRCVEAGVSKCGVFQRVRRSTGEPSGQRWVFPWEEMTMAPHPLWTAGYKDGERDAVAAIVRWLESLGEDFINDAGLNATSDITDMIRSGRWKDSPSEGTER